jgi:hypothetical protein
MLLGLFGWRPRPLHVPYVTITFFAPAALAKSSSVTWELRLEN